MVPVVWLAGMSRRRYVAPLTCVTSGSARTLSTAPAQLSHWPTSGKRRSMRMSPPLRTPARVGCTRCSSAPMPIVAVRSFAIRRPRAASSTVSMRRMTLNIAQGVDVGSRRRDAAGTRCDQTRDVIPPLPERAVRPTLPCHLPPCLRARQAPPDRDGVGLVVEPYRRTDQDVAQRHSAFAGAGRVFADVPVDDQARAAGTGLHPVDDEDLAV